MGPTTSIAVAELNALLDEAEDFRRELFDQLATPSFAKDQHCIEDLVQDEVNEFVWEVRTRVAVALDKLRAPDTAS